ncbi:MAG: HlyD family efflux transporter periplasmic adaptor subunit [Xanthomonadales bacterium]|nr:HlyD family efflux transporter periplasmic adaptor subunit [Xanthomonadales bacterium]NIX11625.1 HlyD family efflux transporter periplasmic adaptor subunit [Xanthomonadales bacterium]
MKIADTSAQDVALEPGSSHRRWIMAASGVALLILMAWLVGPWVQRWAGSATSVPRERLRLATVERTDLVRDVSVQGRVVAAVSPTLFAPAAGTITVGVEAGDHVAEGQTVAVLDSPELQNRLQQEQATLDRLRVELDRQRIEAKQKALDNRKNIDLAKVTLVAAERERRRAESGYDIAAISEIDFEKTKDDLETARLAHQHAEQDASLDDERLAFELQTRELQVERQDFLVQDLVRRVNELEVRSPVSGIVGNLLVDQKAAVARNQEIMAVVDLTAFEIEAQVPESYADDLGLGMAAEVRVGNQYYPAVLVSVSPEIIQNQVTTRVRFDGGMPPGLRQNQRLTTRILMEEKTDVLTLQRGQFLDSGGSRVAYVLGEDNVARRRAIEVGARSLAAVEVVSGLAEGEHVVISSVDQFLGADSVLVTD